MVILIKVVAYVIVRFYLFYEWSRNNFIFGSLRLLNKDRLPSRFEVRWRFRNDQFKAQKMWIAVDYGIMGKNIDDIANRACCTRERIRQILMKGCRD